MSKLQRSAPWRGIAVLLVLVAPSCTLEEPAGMEVRDAGITSSDAAVAQPSTNMTQPEAGSAMPWLDAAPSSAADTGADSNQPSQADAGSSAMGPAVDAAPSAPSAAPDAGSPARGDAMATRTRCKAGTYQGTFAGATADSLLPPSTVSGTFTVKLEPVQGQDFLTMTGHAVGVRESAGLLEDDQLVELGISALLECATHTVLDGELISKSDGTERVVGTLDGYYSDSPHALTGSWTVPDLLSDATGVWSAFAAP